MLKIVIIIASLAYAGADPYPSKCFKKDATSYDYKSYRSANADGNPDNCLNLCINNREKECTAVVYFSATRQLESICAMFTEELGRLDSPVPFYSEEGEHLFIRNLSCHATIAITTTVPEVVEIEIDLKLKFDKLKFTLRYARDFRLQIAKALSVSKKQVKSFTKLDAKNLIMKLLKSTPEEVSVRTLYNKLKKLAEEGKLSMRRNGEVYKILYCAQWMYRKSKTNEMHWKRYQSSYDHSCRVPILDPWDSSIIKYVGKATIKSCKQVQGYDNLAYMTKHGSLLINETIFLSMKSDYALATCSFYLLDRGKNDSDIKIVAKGSLKPNSHPVIVKTDVVEIKCVTPTNVIVYYDVIAHPANLNRIKRISTDSQHLAVTMIIFDGTSYSMFRRNMIKSFDYMTNVMGFKVLRGYNKVGVNTQPNMIPVLTGKRPDETERRLPSELNVLPYIRNNVSTWPIIWKQMASNGYVTSYLEDMPEIGLFWFLLDGFTDKPVDHFYRPFFLAIERSELFTKSSRFCFGNTLIAKKQINTMERHLLKYRSTRRFDYFFFSQLSHDSNSDLQLIDTMFYEMLKRLHEASVFNDTALFVMSDHGDHRTEIRKTIVGTLEERMPFFSIRLPEWLYRSHPNIKHNLEANKFTLATPFDVHETLVDLYLSNFNASRKGSNARAESLFNRLPRTRTCSSVEVPRSFCTCAELISIAPNSSHAIMAAQSVSTAINDLLAPVNHLCSTLNVIAIFRAETFTMNEKEPAIEEERNWLSKLLFRREIHSLTTIRVIFRVSPSGADIDGSIDYNSQDGTIKVSPIIERINTYGNQSACMRDSALFRKLYVRQFCNCIN